jgi:hypothetical protein
VIVKIKKISTNEVKQQFLASKSGCTITIGHSLFWAGNTIGLTNQKIGGIVRSIGIFEAV